jgi:hypothetical protein
MPLKRYTASADTTIVNAFEPNLRTRGTGANAGYADVSEVYSVYGRETTSSQELSRILTQFPVTTISSDRTAGTIPASGSVSFYLRMFNASHSKTVPEDYTLVVSTVSQSWQEGVGLDLEGYKDVTKGNTGANWMSAYSNYGVGVYLSASYEAFSSGSADTLTKRIPGHLDRGNEDDTQSVIYNPSGSTKSYYTKRFFARGTQYFYKRPAIEARWKTSTQDQRGSFFFSSSLVPAAENLYTIYFYNYVRGQLVDIPNLGSTKCVYVSIYSGSVGGFYTGGDGDDVGHVRSANLTVVTGGIVSTGVYSASFAFTGTTNPNLDTIYDVWFTGSHQTPNANKATIQFFTGSIKCNKLRAQNHAGRRSYYINVTNLRDKYRADEKARFNLYVRDKHWDPTVYTTANTDPSAISIVSASYRVYRVLDAYEAIPYGTGSDLHTLMSYDISGNYFDLELDLLEPGYEYALKFSFYENALASWVEQPDVFKFRVEDYEY